MRIVTHSGNFHADDIFAVATLSLLYPDAEIVRSRKPEDWATADILVDVGEKYEPANNLFDHHQPGGAGVRENGIPYASFGLLWKMYGEKLAGDADAAEIVDERLGVTIDAIDNGFELSTAKYPGLREYSIVDYLYSYLDPKNTDETYLYETFIKLTKLAGELLEREMSAARSEASDMHKVLAIAAASADKSIIILDEPLAWGRALRQVPEALYLVYPRKEGSWGVRALPSGEGSFQVRKPLPEAWVGASAEELSRLSGVPDAMFMHRGRFLAAARSKAGALALALKALNS